MEAVDTIIDYAMPTMKAERALKELHEAALRRDYDSAIVKATEAVVESRMALNSLRIMQERAA